MGQERHGKSSANEDTSTIDGDARLGQSGVLALLWLPVVQGLLPLNFKFAISACEWQSAKPRTGKTSVLNFSNFRCHYIFCTVFAIWWSQQLFGYFSHTGYGDGSFLHFGRPLHRPIPVRCKGNVLHLKCIPQQNSQWQFWASVLLTSVRQDAVSPSGNAFPGSMLDPSFKLSEADGHFPISHPSVFLVLNSWPLWLASPFLVSIGTVSRGNFFFLWNRGNLLLSALPKRARCSVFCIMMEQPGSFTTLGVVFFLFMASGEVSLCTNSKGWTLKPSKGWIEFRPLSLTTGVCIWVWMHFVIWTVDFFFEPDTSRSAMFPFSWQPRSWMSPPITNPDPMMQSMWAPAASTVLPANGIVGQFCGGDPQVNQQAQSQAQISALQHQNALLNQQLATQAASHIHQLQQVLRPSSSVPNPQTPAPSEPPQPTVQPEVKTTTPPPVHTDEMLQKLRSDFKAEMENILQKFHDSSQSPTLPSSYHSVATATGAIQRPTTFQHSTITCPCSSLSLTSPPDKRPVSTYRSPPRRRARSTHSMHSHRQPSRSPREGSLRLRSVSRSPTCLDDPGMQTTIWMEIPFLCQFSRWLPIRLVLLQRHQPRPRSTTWLEIWSTRSMGLIQLPRQVWLQRPTI